MRISIVDDHPIVRRAVADAVLFIDRDCTVETFGDCESFVAAHGAAPMPDMLLLDLILPGYQGAESVAHCRKEFPDLPIVVFSGLTDEETVLAALDAGAMSVIPKTATSNELIEAIRTVLGGGYYVPRDALAGGRGESGSSGHAASGAGSRALERLTERQQHVLRLLLRGAPNKRIGVELQLSENTVKSHVSAILRALGVRNRTEAVLAAHRLQLTHQLRDHAEQ